MTTATARRRFDPSAKGTIDTTLHGDTVWVRIGNALIVGNRADLKAKVEADRRRGARNVVVDFLDCGYVDSSGLGVLFAIHTALRKVGGGVAIQNLNDDLRTLFQLTQLDQHFAIIEDRRLAEKANLIIPRFEQINNELVEYFAKHPERLHSDLDWRGLELLLDAIFRNQGFRTQIGSGRADGGIDLRLVQSDACGELVTLVQVKKYARNHPIRLEAVQALCAVVDDRKANRGVFVTTSRYLPSAREFADRQGHRLTLCDSADVATWCAQLAARGIR